MSEMNVVEIALMVLTRQASLYRVSATATSMVILVTALPVYQATNSGVFRNRFRVLTKVSIISEQVTL
jgi:hypothetical protein